MCHRLGFFVASALWALCLLSISCSEDNGASPTRIADQAKEASGKLDPGDGGSEVDAGSCHATAPTKCMLPKPNYASVAPIFKKRCVVCHDGATADGPWPLTAYDHVADWYDTIQSDLLTCVMPPADSNVMMTKAERVAVLNWIRCGFPK